MKQRVDELIRETYVFDVPELKESVPEINIPLGRDERYSGTVSIFTGNNSRLRGIVLSDNRRIIIKDEEIIGCPCSIRFQIDPTGLRGGDVIEGNIFAETSVGEMKIPVKASVKEDIPEELQDDLKALEDFTRLAESSPAKAFRFFVSEDFPKILNGKNTVYRALYGGLSQNPVTYQHMEEFLISAGKKEPVHISIDKRQKTVYHLSDSQKDTLYIYKSTWGYCSIDVSVTGDFLQVSKGEITSDDFIGRVYGLEYIIDKTKLTAFPQIGKITLRTPYEEIAVEIEAVMEGGMKLISGVYRKKRIASLISSFLDLRLRRTDYHTWYQLSSALLKELKEEKEDGITLFGEAYLAYCNEDNIRATEILWDVKNGAYRPQENWEKAAYLYLSKRVGILPDEKRDIAPKLSGFYHHQPACYLLYELYMKENQAPPYRLNFGLNEFEKAFEEGCISPFLYLMAWRELEKQENRLRSISPFMLQVLNFAQKKKILSESILKRAAFLAANEKTFRPLLYRVLKEGYKDYPGKELLEAICRYIVKDDPSKPEYYTWYKQAVDADIRLNRLYENYMETRPEDDDSPFPRELKLYFAYNHTLGRRKKAALYAGIVRHKEEDPAAYDNFRIEMETFAVDCITAGRISRDLAVLYNEFIMPRKDLELASAMARVLFTHRVTCDDPTIRKVVVCHPSLINERTYEMTGGEAFPNIYGPDACVLLEDERKRRFSTTIPYTLEPLMDIKTASRNCVDIGVWDTGLQLYCCHERGWQMDVNGRTVLSFLKAAENPEFTPQYRDRLRDKLLVYFSRQSNDSYAHTFAENLNEETYGKVDKKLTFDLLDAYRENEKAFSLVNLYGYEKLDEDMLLKLAAERIYSLGYEASEPLVRLCSYLFDRGKYNERTLKYLTRHYEGPTDNMVRIWLAAPRGEKSTISLEERILLSAMFTHSMPEKAEDIFADYTKENGNPAIIRAFLTYLSEYSLLENRSIAPYTAKALGKLCDQRDQRLKICMLAWLKYESTLTRIDDEDVPRIRRHLKNCSADELHFAFMQAFTEQFGDGMDIADKTIIEERQPCGSNVLIHYRTDDGEYRSEPMKEKIKGLFVKEFLLFCHEKLEYYCTVRIRDKSFETEHRTVTMTRVSTGSETRYQILNRLIETVRSGDGEKARTAAGEYLRQEACVDKFFSSIL